MHSNYQPPYNVISVASRNMKKTLHQQHIIFNNFCKDMNLNGASHFHCSFLSLDNTEGTSSKGFQLLSHWSLVELVVQGWLLLKFLSLLILRTPIAPNLWKSSKCGCPPQELAIEPRYVFKLSELQFPVQYYLLSDPISANWFGFQNLLWKGFGTARSDVR